MNAIQINFADFVQIQETQPVTNSKFVAEAFGKRHDHVLAKIDELKAEIPADFHIPNFREMEIEAEIGLGKTRKAKTYQLTKDGFMLLVMGFTGKQAMQIKIAYIEAFNAMAAQLSGSLKLSPEQKQQIRQAVQQRHHRTGEHWQAIYEKLHSFCKVNSYHEIAADQFQAAMQFLASMENAPDLFGQHKTVLDDRAMQHIKALVNYLPYMIEFYHIVEPAVRCLNRGLTYHAHDRFTHAHIAIRGLARSLNMPIMEYHEAHAILTS